MRILITVLFFFLSFTSISYAKTFYGDADSRAYRVPEKYFSDLDKLTDYLVKPYQKNDELKARVLFAFIVYHIQYDIYEYESGYEWERKKAPIQSQKDAANQYQNFKQTPHETFKSRRGVCRHLTNLFQYMANRSGLKSVEIDGMANGALHAWNAVKIKDKWHLLDVTWAGGTLTLQGINSDKKYKRALEIRKRKIKNNRIKNSKTIRNEWFLSDPEKFYETHKPHDLTWTLIPKLMKNGRTKLP